MIRFPRTALALLLATLATPLAAQQAAPAAPDPVVQTVVETLALPRFKAFRAATEALAQAAEADCRATDPGLRGAWNAAMDAWLPVQVFRAGPLEDEGRSLAIAFWPDPKGATDKALRARLAGDPATLATPAAYGAGSVAGRGLYALEAMLFDPAFNGYGPADPGCALVRAAAGDLAATAATAETAWRESFGPQLMAPGAAGNTRFLTVAEARQSLFTALIAQLGFDAETRLGRPLGSIDRPRPERAESRDAGRPLRNLALSTAANAELARALGGTAAPTVMADLDYAQKVAARLEADPLLAGVATPTGRMKVEELKTALERSHDDALAELSAALGVNAGFNALDGD